MGSTSQALTETDPLVAALRASAQALQAAVEAETESPARIEALVAERLALVERLKARLPATLAAIGPEAVRRLLSETVQHENQMMQRFAQARERISAELSELSIARDNVERLAESYDWI